MESYTFQYPRVGIAVLIFDQEGRLLLGKRRSLHGSGTWACPGGHLEKFESPEGCALREAKEETGLILKVPEFFDLTNDYFPESGKHYVTLFYLAQLEKGTPKVTEPDKVEEWKWLSVSSLPTPLFTPLVNLLKRPRFQALINDMEKGPQSAVSAANDMILTLEQV